MDPWIPNDITGSDQALRTVPGTYGGYSLVETSGSAVAEVVLYDNAEEAAGTVLEHVVVQDGRSVNLEYKRGVRALNGIFVNVVSGEVAGSVRTN